MKKIYEAANAVEAHMILNLLEQHGIVGRVDGEFLQGAIGELPAGGLIRVMVPEEDYAAAKPIIDQWDKAQPTAAAAPQQHKSASRIPAFLAGLAVGLLGAYLYYQTPVFSDGIDHNRDGKWDEKWTYSSSGLPIKNEVDRNLDGKIDYVTDYGKNGLPESNSTDDNFDGVFETSTIFDNSNPYRAETDTDGDGFADLKTVFANGVVVTTEYIFPATGLPQKVEHFKLGKRIYAEVDTDKDGKLDQRTNYDELGNVTSTENIR
jgi:hypothetical protein